VAWPRAGRTSRRSGGRCGGRSTPRWCSSPTPTTRPGGSRRAPGCCLLRPGFGGVPAKKRCPCGRSPGGTRGRWRPRWACRNRRLPGDRRPGGRPLR
jgi:hypothetical protein